MAVGAQFSSLQADLRAELRRPSSASIGVADLDTIKRTLNSVYTTLLADYEWPHLRTVFDKIPLVAGQQVYDYPVGFDPDNIEQAVVWLGSMNTPIKRRVDLDFYSFLDPSANQRSDPPLAWDVKLNPSSGVSQIEIWPIPASASFTIQFAGVYAPAKMVNDSDVCMLDDELVIGFAAARLLKSQGSEDAEARAQQAESYLLKKKAKPKSNAAPVQMGLGLHRYDRPSHPSIVIKPNGGT